MPSDQWTMIMYQVILQRLLVWKACLPSNTFYSYSRSLNVAMSIEKIAAIKAKRLTKKKTRLKLMTIWKLGF